MTRPALCRIALWLAGLALAAALVARTEFRADLSAFLPRHPTPAQQVLVDQLRSGSVSRLLLIGIEGAPPAALARLSATLAANLRQAPQFAAVGNGDERDRDHAEDFLWRNRYLLSPGVSAAEFTAAGLHRALERDLDILASPAAPAVKRFLPGDPTGEMLRLARSLYGGAEPLRRDGVWFSPGGKRAVLTAETAAEGSDIDGQARALALIHAAFAAAPGAAQATLLVSGPATFAVATRAEIEGDAWRFSLVASALVIALLIAAYRSPLAVGLALLPVASGALAGVAAVAAGFGFVHGLTLGFGVTLIGEAVDYAIYLLTQAQPGEPPETALKRIWPTLLLGMLTSVCGFAALLFSSFAGLAQLGLFSVAGLVVALGVTRWILPPLLPRDFTLRLALLPAASLALVRRAPRWRWPALALVAAAALFLVAERGALWNDDLASLSPVPRSAQRLDQALRNDVGAPDVRYLLVVAAPSADAALAGAERAGDKLAPLVAAGALAGFESPARLLPSRAAQQARQAALPAPAALAASLAEAGQGLPFRADAFQPFLDAVAAARQAPPIDRHSVAASGLGPELDALLQRRGAGWTALLPLRGVADPARLAAAFAAPGGPLLLDVKAESEQLYRTYRREAGLLALAGAGAIAVLLAASLRSVRRAARVIVPLAAAAVVTAALIVAGGGRLSLFNLVGLLLVAGVGSNYALFFEGPLAAAGEGRTAAAVILANLCTAIGFGVLTFSHLPVLHEIGLTVALGAVLSLVFAAILTAAGEPRIERPGETD